MIDDNAGSSLPSTLLGCNYLMHSEDRTMLSRRRTPLAILILAVAVLLWIARLNAAQESIKSTSDIAVLVNPANPVAGVSLAELRRIIGGDRRSWDGKIPVQIVMRSEGTRERLVSLNMVLRMNEREYKSHWLHKVFTGEVPNPPLEVPSNGAQCEFVTSQVGGVALVTGHDVRLSLKVLKIDGKLPGEPDYPLK
jgi:hypothetical protein